MELKSTECLLCFAEDAASLRREEVQNQRLQLCTVEAAQVHAQGAQAGSESNIQLQTAS